ncbi:MAG: hypothetical protein Q9208_003396 [Pyrenodesmia sp. 3 TL-2023]
MSSMSKRIHDMLYPPFPTRDKNPIFEDFTEGCQLRGITGRQYHHLSAPATVWHMSTSVDASTGDELTDAINDHFTNETERIAYCEWFASPLTKRRTGNCEPEEQQGCMSGPELIEFLRTADYSNCRTLQDLSNLSLLQNCPQIMVGKSKGYHYEVVLAGDQLCVSRPVELPEKRLIMLDNILGINPNVEPTCEAPMTSESAPRRTRRSEFNYSYSEDIVKAEPDPTSLFRIMFQVGALRVYQGKCTDVKDMIEDEDHWWDTGFNLVLDITTGRARGVWIVYNFWPQNDEGDHFRIEDEDHWGLLRGHDREEDDQVSVAKIADDLAELGPDFEFELRHRLGHEPELVDVVRNEAGDLVRQTVQFGDGMDLLPA